MTIFWPCPKVVMISDKYCKHNPSNSSPPIWVLHLLLSAKEGLLDTAGVAKIFIAAGSMLVALVFFTSIGSLLLL